jgi:RHS repeat-associated protein
MRNSILVAAAVVTLLGPERGAGAIGLPAAGSVTASTVKLPDGPGSVRGLANDAGVSSFTGQVSYEIPIALPGGAGGLAPKLALSYNGALGNGPLGIGWTIGQVEVRRSLRLGVPTYTDNDELELVGLGGPTLVPIGNGQYRAEGQGNAIRGTAIDGGFELIDAAGTHYRLGTSDASRLESGTMVAAWLLERVTDVAGHVINYTYERHDGELFLTAITWGGDNVFRADLNYEDRPDKVLSWRTGFSVTAGRRLTSVALSAFGTLRNTVVLTYDQSFALSRLATVKVVGASDGVTSPTTTLSYATAAVGQTQQLSNTGGWSLGSMSTVSFFDVDKDGAMDLLRVDSGSQRYKRNLGGSFGPEVVLGNAPAVTLSTVRMLDLDGDSGAEMVTKSGSTWRSFRIVNNAWVGTDWPGSAAIDLNSVAVADLNGDNRMDVLTASGSGISVWFGTANGFSAPRTLPPISANESTIKPNTVQFHDLNGDGLADAIAVNSNGLIEFRGRGDGTFERVGAVAYPWSGTTDTTQLRLGDLDRDGLLDIVRVGTAQVFWYRGQPDGTFQTQATLVARPAGADATTVVTLADANGNGSTDIIWSSPNGMWALDMAGPTNAGLLTSIDNGLGKVQKFGYTASAQLAWAAEKASSPWALMMPVSIAVATTATLTFGSGEPDRISQLSVRDGIYEQAERRFIGFAQSIQTFPGIGASDTISIVTQYHPGHGDDRVLRGQVLSTQTQDGAGNVFKKVVNQVVAIAVDALSSDARLKRAALVQTDTTHSEPGEAPALVRTRFRYDGEGRQIEEDRDGRVVDGVQLDGDETVLRQVYTSEDATTGVRDLVCEQITLDSAGNEVTHLRRFFGDVTTEAPLGQPGKGWLREEQGYLAGENRWVPLKQTSYDGDGNPILVVADGVQRTIGYDAAGLHPVTESVSPGNGQTLTWSGTWDEVAGTLTRVAAPNGTSTTMTYDGLGRLVSKAVNGGLPHVFYRYNFVGPRPSTETFTFDGDPAALGPLPTPWTPASGWRHTVVVANGAGEEILTATQIDSAQWNIGEVRQRDQRGRVIALTSAFGFAGADPSQATPPAGAATQTLVYDPLDRVTDEALPTGTHKRTTFHPLGATVAIDSLASVWTTLDGQGRAIHTERSVNGVVESVDATYDAAGRILQFSLQGGQVHHDFTYDSLGRLTFATDPDVGPRTMTYDDAGRLLSTQNGAGDIVAYGYDAAGRLTSVDGTGVRARYHYDVPRSADFDHTAGFLAWVEEPTGSVDFGYDTQGRQAIIQRTLNDGGTTIVGKEVTQYTLSGLTRSVDLGDGVALPITYDAAGRVAQVSGVWSVQSYNAADLPLSEQFANGVTQGYERDVANRPTRITVAGSAGSLYDVAATYNPMGAIATLSDRDQVGLDHSATFDFDGAGRLTAGTVGAAPGNYQFSYAYDGLQNLVRRDASGPTPLGILTGTYQYATAAPRQLSQIVDGNGAALASFSYDGAGRQRQHASNTLTYDALSHLVRVDTAAGGTVMHQYGFDGKRVSTRDAHGDTTYFITPNVVVRGAERDHYVHVGDRLIAKITTRDAPATAVAGAKQGQLADTGIVAVCLVGLGLAVRRRRGLLMRRSALAASLVLVMLATSCVSRMASRSSALVTTAMLYFHRAYSAGPELTTDASGQLREERREEPFGAAIDSFHDGAILPIDYRRDPVNGLNKLSDPDTGWSDHGARWLAPETAQWHTPDPPATAPDASFMLQPWSLNPYQYVNQNPVVFWDPDGREPLAKMTGSYWDRDLIPAGTITVGAMQLDGTTLHASGSFALAAGKDPPYSQLPFVLSSALIDVRGSWSFTGGLTAKPQIGFSLDGKLKLDPFMNLPIGVVTDFTAKGTLTGGLDGGHLSLSAQTDSLLNWRHYTLDGTLSDKGLSVSSYSVKTDWPSAGFFKRASQPSTASMSRAQDDADRLKPAQLDQAQFVGIGMEYMRGDGGGVDVHAWAGVGIGLTPDNRPEVGQAGAGIEVSF